MYTLLDHLHESLKDLAAGKGEPARATYPKTTFKRFADEWNHKMCAWYKHNVQSGRTMHKRNSADPLIIDCYEGDRLVSTAVVENYGEKDVTFNFFNHESDPKNKYNKEDVEHVGIWKWEEVTLDNTHHSDQRNAFTQNNPTKTGASHRQKDGYSSLQDIISSTRRK